MLKIAGDFARHQSNHNGSRILALQIILNHLFACEIEAPSLGSQGEL